MPLGGLFRGLAAGLIAIFLIPASASAIDEFPLPPGTGPGGITAGPDGAMWFLAETTSKVHRMTTAGVLDPPAGFQVTISGSDTSKNTLDQITTGPDGALWFTEPRDSQIGRITTAGTITEYPVPLDGAPEGITVGSDGALWFTASGIGKIGRISPNPPNVVTLYPSSGVAGSGLSGSPSPISAPERSAGSRPGA